MAYIPKRQLIIDGTEFTANGFTSLIGFELHPSEILHTNGTPTPSNPLNILGIISSNQNIIISDGTNTTTYQISFGNLEMVTFRSYTSGYYKSENVNYLYKNNNNWYFRRKTKKIILNGSEDWTALNVYNNRHSYTMPIDNISKNSKIISTHYMTKTGGSFSSYNYSIGMTYSDSNLGIRNDDLTTLDSFKTWLNNNNVTVYYDLLEPVDEIITDTTLINQLNAIEFLQGKNIITTEPVVGFSPLGIMLDYYGYGNYYDVIYSGGSLHKLKISFNGVELADADRYCEKITRTSRVLSQDGSKRFTLDNFMSQEITLILHDIDTSIIQNQVEISIGTWLSGNGYVYVPLGVFNIQDTPTTDKNKTTIKLRDNRVKFDVPYNAKPLIDSLGGSATKKQILNDICTKSGVTNDVTTFYGENDLIGTYDSTVNGNIYVIDIAEQAGLVPIITREGHLDFVNLQSSTIHKIPLNILEKYELGNSFEIKRIVFEDGIRKYQTSSDETLDTLYLNSANPYISSQEQINNIFSALENYKIDSVKTGKIMGDPAIDPWDLIQVYGYYTDLPNGNKQFVADENTIVFETLANQTMTYTGKIISTYDTQIGIEERKENVTIKNEGTYKKIVKAEIDQLNGSLTLLAQDLEENYSTTTEMNSAIQLSAQGIEQTVSQTYETKSDATSKLGEAKTYAEGQASTAENNAKTYADGVGTSAVSTANNYTDGQLVNYSTTTQMNSAINQKADEIYIDVNKNTENINGIIHTIDETEISNPLYIENAQNSKPIEMELYGDTYQETYSGKNLFDDDISNYKYSNSNNALSQITGGVRSKFTGTTSTINRYSSMAIKNSNNLLGKTCTFSGTITPSASNTGAIKIYQIKSTGEVSGGMIADALANPTFTFPSELRSDAVGFGMLFYSNTSGTVAQNDYVDYTNIQLEVGSTATSYEKYVGGYQSPNPDFPQNIEVVTGRQNISIVGKNLFVPTLINNGTYIYLARCTATLSDGEYTLTATGADMFFGSVANPNVIYSNDKGVLYEFTSDVYQVTITNTLFTKNYVTYYDENKVSLGYISKGANKFDIQKTDKTGAKYFSLRLGYGSAVSGTSYKFKVQLERGTKKTDYEKYNGNLYEINLGKNLININDTYYKRGDYGDITINNNVISVDTTQSQSTQMIWWNILVKIGKPLTISYGNLEETTADNNNAVFYLLSDTPYTSFTNFNDFTKVNKTNRYATITPTKQYLTVALRTPLNNTSTLSNLQVEYGNSPTTYAPYKTPVELCKISTYRDYIKKSTGKNLFDKDNANILNMPVNGNALNTSENAKSLYISITGGKTYTIQKIKSSRFRVETTQILPTVGVSIDNYLANDDGITITINTSLTANYLLVYYFLNGTDTLTEQEILNSIQIEENSSATDPEPYGVGKWYVCKKVGKVTLDGTESVWAKSGTSYVIPKSSINNQYLPSGTTNYYCNYFTVVSSGSTVGTTRVGSTNLLFNYDSSGNYLNDFKTWLSTHNTIVYYILYAPTYTEITDTELINQLNEIELLTGINNITITSDDLPADMYLKYYLHTPLSETYINQVQLQSSLDITSESITASVSKETDDKLSSYATKTEVTQTSEGITARIDKISTNIDENTGDVERIKTSTGYTFDENGMSISKDDSDFSALHTNEGTFYKNNGSIVSQITKDNIINKDMVLYGKYYYGVDSDLDVENFTKDDAMFIAEMYEDGNGEVAFGHFLNQLGGN